MNGISFYDASHRDAGHKSNEYRYHPSKHDAWILRHNYRQMRRAGMSAFQARHILVAAMTAGRYSDLIRVNGRKAA